jgi:hypothetical protein
MATLDLSSGPTTTEEVVVKPLFTGKLSWPAPVMQCLEIVATLEMTAKDKTDSEKLETLQSFLKKELSSSEISEEEKTAATRFVDETLPHVVLAVLAVSKGQVSLKAVEAVKEKVAELAEPAAAALATAEGKLAQVVGAAKVEEWKKEVVAAVPASCWGCFPKQVKTTIVPPPTSTESTVSV